VKANAANSNGGNEQNELVCMARAVHTEQAFVARRTINYTDHPHLPRPRPQPIPVLSNDFTGVAITNTTQYVTLSMPINLGEFKEIA
jgi:hypothetical protein